MIDKIKSSNSEYKCPDCKEPLIDSCPDDFDNPHHLYCPECKYWCSEYALPEYKEKRKVEIKENLDFIKSWNKLAEKENRDRQD